MASANIANLSVLLSGNSIGLDKSLASSQGKIAGWLAKAKSMMSMNDVAFGGGSGGFMAGGAGLKGLAVSLGTQFASKLREGIQGAFDRLRGTINSASAAGIATDLFQALQYQADQAGVPVDKVGDAMRQYTGRLYQAQAGNQEALLGFQMLGITFEQLQRMTPEEALRAVADGMNNMNDPANRVATSLRLFGESGGIMPRVLQGGSAALSAAQRELRGFGGALSALDQSRIEESTRGMARFRAIWEGITTRALIALVPILENINTLIFGGNEGAVNMSGNFQVAADVAKTIATPFVFLFNVVQEIGDALGVAIDFGMTHWHAFLASVLSGLETIADGLARLPNALGGGQAAGLRDTIAAARGEQERQQQAGTAAWEQRSTWNPGSRIAQGWNMLWGATTQNTTATAANTTAVQRNDEARAATIGAVQQFETRLREQIATFGMDTNSIERWRLAQQGATPAMLAVADALGVQMLALEERQKLVDEAKSLDDALASPLTKFEDSNARLQKMLDQGLITHSQYTLGIMRNYQQLAQSQGEMKAPEALTRGSQQEVNMRIQARIGAAESPEQAMRRTLEAQLAIEREQLRISRDMARNLEAINAGQNQVQEVI